MKENRHEWTFKKSNQNRAGMSPLFFVLHIEPLARLDQTNR